MALKKKSHKKTVTKKPVKTEKQIDVDQLLAAITGIEVLLRQILSRLGENKTDTVSTDPKQIELPLKQTQTNAPENKTVETKPSTVTSQSVTREQVVQALQKISAKHGLAKVQEVLKKFGAQRISELPEKEYSSVILTCSQAN